MDTIDRNISYNLKKIRKGQNLSLDMLAERTGVSKSMLGQIERSESNPTITTIAKICEGLKVSIEELVYRQQETVSVVKKEQCRTQKQIFDKYEVRLVFPFEKNRNFEIYTATIEPGAEMKGGLHGSHTSEYVTVTGGSLQLKFGEEEIELSEGDSFCLNANEEYAFRNKGEKKTEIHIVMTVA